MLLLVENCIPLNCIKSLNRVLKGYGMQLKVYKCEINEHANFDEIRSWAMRFEEKTMIVTGMKIKTNSNNLAVDCKGISDRIGGILSIVSFENSEKFTEICIHEILHLEGMTHCHNEGCLMSVKLCDNDIKYCVLCKNRCTGIELCGECDSLWKEKLKLKFLQKMDL